MGFVHIYSFRPGLSKLSSQLLVKVPKLSLFRSDYGLTDLNGHFQGIVTMKQLASLLSYVSVFFGEKFEMSSRRKLFDPSPTVRKLSESMKTKVL